MSKLQQRMSKLPCENFVEGDIFHRIVILLTASINIQLFQHKVQHEILLREYLVYMEVNWMISILIMTKEAAFAVISLTYDPIGNSLIINIISRNILLNWNQTFDELGPSFQNGIELHHCSFASNFLVHTRFLCQKYLLHTNPFLYFITEFVYCAVW